MTTTKRRNWLLPFLTIYYAISTSTNAQPHHAQTNKNPTTQTSTIFPPLDDTIQLLQLSTKIYSLRRQTHHDTCLDAETKTLLGPDITCHLYERDTQDTQMMIVSHRIHKYIAVVFAGTDDFRNVLTDSNIVTKSFGPNYPNGTSMFIPEEYESKIRVHAGFDHAVFQNGLFDRIYQTIRSIRSSFSGEYMRLFTTGHSLGAADSILTAVALKHYYVDDLIVNINFGCPKTGNRYWKEYVDSIPRLGIWRFVNGADIVPRLPDFRFVHVGHTVQMEKEKEEEDDDVGGMKAYYLHRGDKMLCLEGVPKVWSSEPFMVVHRLAHPIQEYVNYIETKSKTNQDVYYFRNFEISPHCVVPSNSRVG